MIRSITALLAATFVVSPIFAAEPEPTASAPEASSKNLNMAVYPQEIKLDTARDYQSFIAVVTRQDDVTQDVTQDVAWKIADENIAKIQGDRIVPVADGKTELLASKNGVQLHVPITVTRSEEKLPVSFEKDIVPIMTRSGCNTGSCHGAARGKDGFMISLFGYDPVGDYKRITREIGFRRINLAKPEESLFLTKATGKVQHTGGKLFDEDSYYYKTILEWLQNGAPKDPTPPPRGCETGDLPTASSHRGHWNQATIHRCCRIH